MKILLGQNHMNSVGGTEDYTYPLAVQLKKEDHDVEVFTLNKGIMSDKLLKEFGIKTNAISGDYDICFCNHNTTINTLRDIFYDSDLKIVQTSHGVFPQLERYTEKADSLVSISEEVREFFLEKNNVDSVIIRNGIDTEKFYPKNKLNTKIKRILSLTQSEKANSILREVANKLNSDLVTLNKHVNPKINIEDDLNNCDIVFGLGRSAYAALSCGRPVFVWDWRVYMDNLGDGFLTTENFLEMAKNNTSGRRYKKQYSVDQIVEEIKLNYNENLLDEMRNIAVENFNIKKSVEKYLQLI
jgi:glycosyltransferase involved in cell wall biosynthesis